MRCHSVYELVCDVATSKHIEMAIGLLGQVELDPKSRKKLDPKLDPKNKNVFTSFLLIDCFVSVKQHCNPSEL